MKSVFNVLIGFVAVPALLVCASGCKKEATEAPKAQPPVVVVESIDQKTVPNIISCIAETQARNTIDLTAQVQGYLVEAPMAEGQPFKKDSLLFLIDPRTYSNAVDVAEAQIEQAKASQERARLDVERYEPLVKANAIPQRDLDNARATLLEQTATLAAAKASKETAQLNLDFCRISAPIDGLAGRRMVDVGNLVTPGTVLATVSDLNPMNVWFTVSELDYLKYLLPYAQGERKLSELGAALLLSDGSTYDKPGAIDFVDRAISQQIGTLTMRAEFENPDSSLRPGQYGTLQLTVGQFENALLVPIRALTQLQSLTMVMVVKDDNICEQRQVTLGARYGNQQVVLDGLKKGERVIVEGVIKVRNGAPCQPMTQDEYAEYQKKIQQQATATAQQVKAMTNTVHSKND